ncbi:MAG: winged helix-turn-helix domain-containing protein, partial [Victivallales bacterium]|nr:winged helix-turn-helix domain-containing protein [Victivallales bacterium]
EVLGDGEASPATIPASVGVPQMQRPAQEPPKRLSLVDAAFEVLKAEGRPMNAAEMARLAVERGLWTAQGGKTPAQTLYARIFEEMRHARRPRFRKASVRGLFEPT